MLSALRSGFTHQQRIAGRSAVACARTTVDDLVRVKVLQPLGNVYRKLSDLFWRERRVLFRLLLDEIGQRSGVFGHEEPQVPLGPLMKEVSVKPVNT